MSNNFERMFRHMGSGELITVLVIVLLVALALLLVYIFFLIALQKTFDCVSPDLRKMNPSGLVWLMLIPYFGNIWVFFIVTRMADSLRGEFDRRQMTTSEERPGFNLGIAWASINAIGLIVGFMDIPILSVLIGLCGLACWITYWVTINRYRKQLEETGHWQQRMQAHYANTYNQQYWQQANAGGFNSQNPPQNPYPPYPPQNPIAPPNDQPPVNPGNPNWGPPNDPPAGN